MICTYILLLLGHGVVAAVTANHLWTRRRGRSANALFDLGLELALDKTTMRQTHMYIMEAVLPPNKSGAAPRRNETVCCMGS